MNLQNNRDSVYRAITKWADTSLHLLLLKCSIPNHTVIQLFYNVFESIIAFERMSFLILSSHTKDITWVLKILTLQ